MGERLHGLVETVAICIELTGVAAILLGGIAAVAFFVSDLAGEASRKDAYHGFRANLGRAILIGLELLVAGDIISTILVERTLESVAALGLIVLIRTFLSFSLETEIQGMPPWRRTTPVHDEGHGEIRG